MQTICLLLIFRITGLSYTTRPLTPELEERDTRHLQAQEHASSFPRKGSQDTYIVSLSRKLSLTCELVSDRLISCGTLSSDKPQLFHRPRFAFPLSGYLSLKRQKYTVCFSQFK